MFIIFANKKSMGRNKKVRMVELPPTMIGYSPFGIQNNKEENVVLNIDEYETIRLIDYLHLKQVEAAKQMNISRPTLTRIYDKARSKIATAFVEGKRILIKGGDFQYSKDWFRCKKCYRLLEDIKEHKPCKGCRHYGNDELEKL